MYEITITELTPYTAEEEVLLGVDSGSDGTCKLYGYRKDGVAHVTREGYSKQQDEPNGKNYLNDYELGIRDERARILRIIKSQE